MSESDKKTCETHAKGCGTMERDPEIRKDEVVEEVKQRMSVEETRTLRAALDAVVEVKEPREVVPCRK